MTRARDVANLIGSGNYSSTTFTATAGQTAFTISHTQGFVQVFMNDLLLDETVDYTSNGSAVTLTSGAAAGDEIEVVAYNTFSVGDALNQAAADTRYVNTTGDTMSGGLTVNGGNLSLNATSEAAHRYLYLNTGATTDGHIIFQRGGSPKFQISADANGHLFTWNYAKNGTSFRVNADGSIIKPHQPQFVVQGDYNNWTQITTGAQWYQLTGATGSSSTASGSNILPIAWRTNNYGGYNPTGSGFNATSGLYTAPVTGTYMFAFQSYTTKYANSGGEYYHVNGWYNGNNLNDYTIYGYNEPTNAYQAPEITKILRMSANDTFEFRIYVSTANTFKFFPTYTMLSGYFLG